MLERVAGLAIHLGREDVGWYRTVSEITADAAELIRAGDAARSALQLGKNPKPAFERAERVAKLYRVRVVERADVQGMVLGLRFASGQFSSGADHVYYVS
jgi:hypothetical protein